MSIDRYLELNPVIIAPNASLKDAVALIAQQQAKNKPSCLLIVLEEQLVGILTQNDVIRLVATDTDLANTTVEMAMTQPVLTMLRAQCHNPTLVWSFLQEHTISHLPIVQGMVS
ncbi:MAG: CBS domain-containing protein [Hydrococcus sp. SU_1_0]|nr:CBS domain-containing protein [Hydrococcus sp. SU_1_0]